MPTYAVAVVSAVVVSTAFMFLIFYRRKVLDFKTLVSIVPASLISALALPGIYKIVSSLDMNDSGALSKALVPVSLLAAYIALVFILSLAISYIIPKIGAGAKAAEPLTADVSIGETSEAGAGENYLEQIFVNFIGENNGNDNKTSNYDESAALNENYLEKSVDSAENIDKMGIENNMHDRDTLTIEECIDEAFRLKGLGDSEGAILYYMYALDKKPEKDLTFWIVLDICVMYKALGQQDLALDILNSYYDIYGDIMDVSVKDEIEKNLTVIHV